MIAIVDASSILHRAWHAGRQHPVEAARISDRLLDRSTAGADEALLLFDGGSARRTAIDPNYKTHRPPQPELWGWLDEQRAAWHGRGWKCVRERGWEADDLAASAVATLSGPIRLVTSDRDWWMLIDDRTVVLRPGDWTTISPEVVREKLGVWPYQLSVYKAMVGDASDGIAGVPGIGPKRAARLIQSHWPHHGWWEPSAPAEVRQRLAEHREAFDRAHSLVLLHTDAPVELLPAPIPGRRGRPEPLPLPLPLPEQGTLWDL